MSHPELTETAAALVASHKGLLAADESFGTIKKRFDAAGIENTSDNRRAYREMLFTSPGLAESISGVILFDETLRQRTGSGVPMADVLTRQGIIPGIKVDLGAVPLAGFPGEKWTQGLDGLRVRLAEYAGLGARFTKWRAVIGIGDGLPTAGCLAANAEMLALFAGLSQEAGLVPIVEPEVLMDGDHSIERCEEVITVTLQTVFAALARQRVLFEGMLLKTGMVLSGAGCPQQADDATIAQATLRCLRRTTPTAVPGVVFLSGGQSEEAATKRLDAISRAGAGPWAVTFSYGRALQDSALAAWAGKAESVAVGQEALLMRARANRAAAGGTYA